MDENISDLAEARLALSRQMAIMDKNSIRQEGIDEGNKEQQIKIAKKLIKMGLSTEEIEEATELSKEEIENLH